ncbi:MAG: carbon-nitrogen hydrolase family protein [Acidobacteria bacterium]|nr:carbon-nitrogen hydrolase family protein [Acidobacteriota bacterium]
MKAAAVQMDIKLLDKQHNLAKVLDRLEAAAQGGAKVVVFPECALTGYCFTSREEALPVAEPVPGPSTDKIAAAAKRLGVTVVVGMLESSGNDLFNSAAVIGPEGLLGTHRKIHRVFLGIDRFDAVGDIPFPVFQNSHAKIGVNICYDCSFPESGRVLKLKGAQILAIPTNWPVGSDTWQHIPKVRAIENHMFVIAADRVGEERGFRFAGHSQIIDLGGQALAEAGDTEETILYAEIDPAAADQNLVVRLPGEWEFDRIAGRRPQMYEPITRSK